MKVESVRWCLSLCLLDARGHGGDDPGARGRPQQEMFFFLVLSRFNGQVLLGCDMGAGCNNLGTKIVISLNLEHHHKQEGILKCLSIYEIFFKKKFPIRKS